MPAFDFKKEYKDLYMPKGSPSIVDVPAMTFIAVNGQGDPNSERGDYHDAVGLLYALTFTIKMSKLSGNAPDGYFEYVVPPLEGFWWMEGLDGFDYTRKQDFSWISVIRQPGFVTEEVFEWAKTEASAKKGIDASRAYLWSFTEGLCTQSLHIGPYDDEPATVSAMDAYAEANGYATDFSAWRMHHEIYLGDPRKCAPEKLKTVIRHPIKRI